LDSVVFRPDDGMVYWGSQGERLQSVALHGAPLHVGAPLQRGLFSGKECVVLTGATLSTEGNFDFIEQRLSLSDGKRLLLDSPFDYRSLAMVWVPPDIPEPGQTGYRRAVEQSILDVSRAAGGRTLGLFTSHLALRSCYEAVYGALRGEGIVVLGQGIDGSTKRLLDAFRAEARTVLLATASFWEGIDVVGEALSVLVIPRLPFGVPTDPVFAARAELFDDPFNQYALPQAILRFKQGFGRLIRSKSDRGVIVVLDRRIKSRNYGTAFLNSLPSCEVRSGPARLLGREVSEWLGRK
ncbi:MAG: ATP-dependent DNA helicase, partial [Chloroflexota bacterium]